MKLLLKNKLYFIDKRILKIFFFIFFLIIFIEFVLRIIGFGNPVLYLNDDNYILKPNQDVRRFKGSKVIINKFGMRTSYNWNDNKSTSKILFFGDSVSFGGSYIDNKNLFSEKFCMYKNNSICGNYGTNGYKLDNIRLRIVEVANKIEFDHLIIVTSSSLTAGKSIFFDFPFYENFNNIIFKSTSEIFNHYLFKYNIADNYHKNKKSYKVEKNDEKNSLKKFELILKKLTNKGIKIDLFILPTLDDLNQKKNFKNLLESIDIKNVKIINLYNNINNQNFEDLYFNNAHLNEKGHDYLSKLLYKIVE